MTNVTANASLAPFTTLRVGGAARRLVKIDTTDEFVDAVLEADAADSPLFVLGGGSNVLVSDDGWAGTVVHSRQAAVEPLAEDGPDDGHTVLVRCEAGVRWDDVVAYAVGHGLSGAEALSGIPGLIGSAVMQNVGAYGQELSSVLVNAELLDRATGERCVWVVDELGLGYRTSMLRHSMEVGDAQGRAWPVTPRWVVLAATFGFAGSAVGHVGHAQLARALGVELGSEIPIAEIRASVLAVRAKKAMLADDPAAPRPDYDRWSTGSFFTNPVLSEGAAARLPADAPRYPAGEGLVKTSAAWLIEHAGCARGYAVREGAPATLSSRHTLALTNRGTAAAEDVLELARTVRGKVLDSFGILLQPETVLVNCEL